jgi:hypothetical protein
MVVTGGALVSGDLAAAISECATNIGTCAPIICQAVGKMRLTQHSKNVSVCVPRETPPPTLTQDPQLDLSRMLHRFKDLDSPVVDIHINLDQEGTSRASGAKVVLAVGVGLCSLVSGEPIDESTAFYGEV